MPFGALHWFVLAMQRSRSSGHSFARQIGLATLVLVFVTACAAALSKGTMTVLDAPPTFSPVTDGVYLGGEGSCPKEFEACLNQPAASALDYQLSELRRYAETCYTQYVAPTAGEGRESSK